MDQIWKSRTSVWLNAYQEHIYCSVVWFSMLVKNLYTFCRLKKSEEAQTENLLFERFHGNYSRGVSDMFQNLALKFAQFMLPLEWIIFFHVPLIKFSILETLHDKYKILTISQNILSFVTPTNTGTMVKHVPQKQMVGIRSYPSKELLSPLYCY